MKKHEIHTLIVWNNACSLLPEVETCILSKLTILDKIEISWQPETFFSNLKIFYAHSQREKKEDAYNAILERKISQIGTGKFFLFVLKDENPEYDYRETTSGNRNINVNIFDLKKTIRHLVGGGNKIHASDNEFESNKDLTLLLHKNIEDYLNSPKKNYYEQNVLGYNGYANIKELFYVLNNSIDYCVLRNYECLPNEYTLEGHGDIDLLVDNFNYIRYLTLAKPVYPDFHYRVHYTINIANEEIPFDFRFLGDNYYDIKWQKKILESRELYNNVYVPNAENYFYSLLYHAYVQKKSIKKDYYPKIENLAKINNIDYHRGLDYVAVKKILDAFLDKNFYQYLPANDPTVIYNMSFVKVSGIENKYGQKLSSSMSRSEGAVYFSEVYKNGDKIVKICSDVIADNEAFGLKAMKNTGFAPELLCVERVNEDFSKIEMQYIQGTGFKEIINKGIYYNKAETKAMLLQITDILIVLNKKRIMHRDIRPDNLILAESDTGKKVCVIDFGWCVSLDDNQPLNPIRLGSKYKYKEGVFSDAYSFGKLLSEYFKEHSGNINKLARRFLDIHPEDYQNDRVAEKLQQIKHEIENNFDNYFTANDLVINFLYKIKVFRAKAGVKNKAKKVIRLFK